MKGHTLGLSAAGLVVVGTVMVLSLAPTPVDADVNVTELLGGYPNYSQINRMFTSTGVAREISGLLNWFTVFVVSDPVISAFVAANPDVGSAQMGDLLRYNCLTEYVAMPTVEAIVIGRHDTFGTLSQSTWRGDAGAVNIYNTGTGFLVGQAVPNTLPTTSILTFLTPIPEDISLIEIDCLIVPRGFGARTTEANWSAVLEAGEDYNTFLGLLRSTGTDADFAALETGSGISIFAPTDAAFGALPSGALDGLSLAQTKLLCQYHALPTYYTLYGLSLLNGNAAPTVATANTSPGQYTLNVNLRHDLRALIIDSGISSAWFNYVNNSDTVYDSPPTVCFTVSTVLLPKEIFAPTPAHKKPHVPAPVPPKGSVPSAAPSPVARIHTRSPSPLFTTLTTTNLAFVTVVAFISLL